MGKRRLLAVVEYDGTDFEGFQVQKHGRTVQDELEAALNQITGEKVRVTGAGRTDTGVHALGQGAHFDTEWHRPIEILQRALNAVLPTDIAIRNLAHVPDDFSARYSATSRTYRYTILNETLRSPLQERYALRVAENLDERVMNDAAQCLVGAHDFGGLGRATSRRKEWDESQFTLPRTDGRKPAKSDLTTRRIYRAQVKRSGTRIAIELEANAFLYRMVRRIAGTLVMVGKGKLNVEEFREVVARKRKAGPAVPPHGLCLIAVNYGVFKNEDV